MAHEVTLIPGDGTGPELIEDVYNPSESARLSSPTP